MKRKFLLLFLMCILMGGVSSLFAQKTVTIDGTVGTWDKNANANAPLNANYTYTTSQQIYLKEELGIESGSVITKVAFNPKSIPSGAINLTRKIKVYMANTTANGFAEKKLVKMEATDLVFEGDFTIDGINKWIEIEFNKNTFKYDGGNILLCVWDYTNAKAGKTVSFNTYKGNNKDDNSKLIIRNIYKTGVSIDPTYTSTFTFSTPSSSYNALPQVQFTYTSGGLTIDKPVFSDVASYYYPSNGITVLNPYFEFYADYVTDYKILASKDSEFTNITYIKGGKDSWVTKDINTKSVQTENIGNLDPGTTYYWKVLAKNVGVGIESEEVESDTFTFTTKAIEAKPDELESCSPTNETVCYDGYPTLSWTYGDNTSQYQLLLGTREDLRDEIYTINDVKVDWKTASTLGDSYQTSGLGLAVGTHYWQVNVRNNAGTTYGDVYSFEIPGVKNISNAEASDTELTWTFDEYATEYRVLLSKPTTDDDPLEVLCNYFKEPQHSTSWLSVPENRKGSYTLPTNLDAGVTYYWIVEVRNFADDKIYVNEVYEYDDENKPYKVFAPEVEYYQFVTSALSAARNSSPKNKTTKLNNPTLEWAFNGDATEYKVFLGTDVNNLKEVTGWVPRGTAEVGGIESPKSTGSYKTEGLTAATKYYWRIDVKNDKGKEVQGTDIWWFGTTLPTTTVEAVPSNIFPSLGVYGGTNINWDLVGAQSYNVYLGEEKIATKEGGVYTHAILDTDRKLKYNMEEGYNIYVEADFGELGSSMSEAVNVKVSGKSKFSGKVFSNDFYTPLADATVTLTLKTDEFDNEIADATEYTYTYKTNSNGEMFETQNQNGSITQVKEFQFDNGKYEVTVEAEYHEPYTGELTIEHNGENNNLSVILTPDQTVIFKVTLFNETFNKIDVYLENSNWEDAQPGYYNVYLKNGEKITNLGLQYFVVPDNMTTSVYFTYTGWRELGKGSYQFGVAKVEDKVNWSGVRKIDYDVFEVEGDWNTAANWRDGVPTADTAKVYLLAPATISAEEEVTAGTVNIEQGGSLTINGSLTAGEVYNNTQAGNLCINDGGQLRQNNQNLNGKFVMNIVKGDWSAENDTTGWQFISSPIQNAPISQFIPANQVQGDYDLYRYDGGKWYNHKAGKFNDTTFVSGRAYLASLEIAETVTLSGKLNAATTFARQLSYNADKELANFHLLGNPFTFDMDLKYVTWYNLVKGFAVVNADGNYEYRTADNNGIIPVGDGFFVKATGTYPSISYNEVATEPATRGSEKANSINVIASGKAGKDNVVVNFAGQAEGFNKLQNFNDAIATVYVTENGKNYGIANVDENTTEVALNFDAKQMGSYTISFDINGEFETVILVDRFTGVETDMLVENEYSFIASNDDNVNRFVIRLANGQQTTDNSQFVYQSGEELILSIEGSVQIVDMLGRVVYSNEHSDAYNRINVSEFNDATYVVRVVNEEGVKVQKVVIY